MQKRDYFKKIDFDKIWDEEDWEEFFKAQDRLVRETRVSAPGNDVFRVIGEPVLLETADGEFWRDGAPLESLPVYYEAAHYVWRLRVFCMNTYGARLYKSYKSPAHRRTQDVLHSLLRHAGLAPRDLALAHDLGYAADTVKGNIARCKRALGHANACLGALSDPASRRLPAGHHRRLFSETLRLRNALQNWIFFLRKRFVRR